MGWAVLTWRCWLVAWRVTDQGIVNHERTEIIFGSDFPLDQTDLQVSCTTAILNISPTYSHLSCRQCRSVGRF